MLFLIVRQNRPVPFRPVFLLFALFITACGWTHFFGYFTFSQPLYRLDGLVKVITAVVSWATVAALIPTVPRVLSMRTSEELETEISARTQALQASEERYRTTFQNAAVGIADVALDGRWLRINGRLCEILGTSEEALRERTFHNITHPDDLDQDLELVRQTLAGERASYAIEKRYIRPDGRVVWANLTVALVRNERAEPQFFISVVEDISARKAAEEEMQRLNASLQRAMAETHHRVKNNLQVISALVEVSSQTGETVAPQDLERLTQHISALAGIHDLLTVQARSDTQLERISIRAALDKLVPNLRAVTVGRTLTVDIEDIALPVRFGTSLAIVVNELTSNAFKHAAQGAIRVTLRSDGDQAILEVDDDGPGFPEDFDPTRAARMGLDLVHQIVTWDLKGTMTAATRAGGGGRVTVAFPIAPDVVQA